MKKRYILAFAYALPPKVQDQSLRVQDLLNSVTRRSAKKVELLLREPLPHGGIELVEGGGKLRVLSSDGFTMREFSTSKEFSAQTPSPKATPSELRSRLWARPGEAGGSFRLGPDGLEHRPEKNMEAPFWTVPLPSGFVGLGWDAKNGWLTGWASFPPRIFSFPPNRRNLKKIDWQSDGEIVSFRPCDDKRAVLVENAGSGVTRLWDFDDERPRAYGVFDFSLDERKSEASGIASKSCHEHYIAGSFGVARVTFGDAP